MRFMISGFGRELGEKTAAPKEHEKEPDRAAPRSSVVQVYFSQRGSSYAYYNDRFDLKSGDWVYVDGKLEGLLGRVTSVDYSFKIRLSDYKRVIALVDTRVHGRFYMAPSHFITFDPAALPAARIVNWFRAPDREGEEYAAGRDDTVSFPLEHLEDMHIPAAIAQRGHAYYAEDRVCYLCLNGTKGFAIVKGTRVYTVEFDCHDGEISSLVCDCFCGYPCKHEFAVMLQLKDTLEQIQKHYAAAYEKTGYFAAITKDAFFTFAVDGRETGCFSL